MGLYHLQENFMAPHEANLKIILFTSPVTDKKKKLKSKNKDLNLHANLIKTNQTLF